MKLNIRKLKCTKMEPASEVHRKRNPDKAPNGGRQRGSPNGFNEITAPPNPVPPMSDHHNSGIAVLIVACLAIVVASLFFLVQPDPNAQVPGALAANKNQSPPAGPAPGPAASANAGKTTTYTDMPRLGSLTDSAALGELSAQTVRSFLTRRGESAANLLAAFSATGDTQWLHLAAGNYPDNPRVQLAVLMSDQFKEPRAEWIERMKKSEPQNPLPHLFAANELLEAGNITDGLAELRAGLQKPAFYQWANESIAARRQLFLDSGCTPTEAGMAAVFGEPISSIQPAVQASRRLLDAEDRPADTEEIVYSLGKLFATPEGSRTLIGQLAGIALQRQSIEKLPSDAAPTWLGTTAGQRLDELKTRREEIKSLTSNSDWLLQSGNATLLDGYLERNRTEGEEAALRWLGKMRDSGKSPTTPQPGNIPGR